MVGVVVTGHGKLAEELLRTAEIVVGKLERTTALSIAAECSMADARTALEEAIRSVDDGDGVLILTDMFGGTPANLALTFLDSKIEVLTGVNLPMLLKLASCRAEHLGLEPTAQLLTNHGQKNITLASELLRTRARSSRN